MNSLRRIFAILQKETRQLLRDRTTLTMVIMIPLVQLILFGYAINTNIRHISVALVDQAQNSYSHELAQDLEVSQVVTITQHYSNMQTAENALIEGKFQAILFIPKDLANRLIHHPSFNPKADINTARPVAQWVVDASDTVVANAISGLRNFPLSRLSSNKVQTTVPPTIQQVNYFNQELRSAVNTVPGLLGIILTMTMVMFTSAAIVREREHGNMEFLINTPVKSIELMIGKVAPFIAIGLLQTVILLLIGRLLFHIPIRGAITTILGTSTLFIFATLTLGLVISTIAKTQLQAMQMTIFVLLPSILLSGFMFPFHAMPKVAQYIGELFPATHFIRIIRGVVLRGADLTNCSMIHYGW